MTSRKKAKRKQRDHKKWLLARKPTPRQRLFTNEFKKGDLVAIIRTEHGWFDGALEGVIVSLSTHSATVRVPGRGVYTIHHPRDIWKCR